MLDVLASAAVELSPLPATTSAAEPVLEGSSGMTPEAQALQPHQVHDQQIQNPQPDRAEDGRSGTAEAPTVYVDLSTVSIVSRSTDTKI